MTYIIKLCTNPSESQHLDIMENSFENYHNFYFRCTQVSFRKLIHFMPLALQKRKHFSNPNIIHTYYMMGYYNAKNPWSVQWCPISRLGLDWWYINFNTQTYGLTAPVIFAPLRLARAFSWIKHARSFILYSNGTMMGHFPFVFDCPEKKFTQISKMKSGSKSPLE